MVCVSPPATARSDSNDTNDNSSDNNYSNDSSNDDNDNSSLVMIVKIVMCLWPRDRPETVPPKPGGPYPGAPRFPDTRDEYQCAYTCVHIYIYICISMYTHPHT